MVKSMRQIQTAQYLSLFVLFPWPRVCFWGSVSRDSPVWNRSAWSARYGDDPKSGRVGNGMRRCSHDIAGSMNPCESNVVPLLSLILRQTHCSQECASSIFAIASCWYGALNMEETLCGAGCLLSGTGEDVWETGSVRKRSTGGVNVGLLSAAEQTTSNTASTSLHVIFIHSMQY